MLYARKTKDPSAALDYLFVWGPDDRSAEPPWLEDAETIAAFSLTLSPSGLTVESSEITPDGKRVLVWLSGGTLGVTYTVACQITTTLSRTETRRMSIFVQNR
jgi:hypothetical protein